MNLSAIEKSLRVQGSIAANKMAFSIDELANMTGMSKAYYRGEIKALRLRAKLFGTRVLVMREDWFTYMENQKDWTPKDENKTEEI